MKNQTSEHYSAVVETGSCDPTYQRWEESANCGHKHKTANAAFRCGQKLQAWSKDGRTCSAKWYNFTIHNQAGERRSHLVSIS